MVECHFSSVESEYIHTSACVSFYSWRIAYKILYLSQPYIWSGLKFAILLLRVHKNISVPSFFENMISFISFPVSGGGRVIMAPPCHICRMMKMIHINVRLIDASACVFPKYSCRLSAAHAQWHNVLGMWKKIYVWRCVIKLVINKGERYSIWWNSLKVQQWRK